MYANGIRPAGPALRRSWKDWPTPSEPTRFTWVLYGLVILDQSDHAPTRAMVGRRGLEPRTYGLRAMRLDATPFEVRLPVVVLLGSVGVALLLYFVAVRQLGDNVLTKHR